MKKIIIIEDDSELSILLHEFLHEEGYEVISYPDKNSVKRIIINRPDLVILDNKLGDGFGSQLCNQIRTNELTKNIPVLLISGYEDLSTLAHEAGANAFLEKPFEFSQLLQMVKTWTNASETTSDSQ